MDSIVRLMSCGFVVALSAALSASGTGQEAPRVPRAAARTRVSAGLPASGGNAFYKGNRTPLTQSPLIKLPLGRVKAGGWLQHQLELMADGFSGHLEEISRFCKFDGNAWTAHGGEGQFGWEEVPYWLKGFVDLSYLTGRPALQAEAKRWIEAVLLTQDANGYFGSRTNLEDAASGAKVLDLWPNMVMLYPLRSYYEATGDRRIIDFMTAYFRWQSTLPLERLLPGSWQKWRAGDNLDSIHWLFNQTGQRWLLHVARVNHERTADWVGDVPTWHGVNLAQCFRLPTQYYQQTRDARYLKATERVYATVKGLYGQFPGGLYGADENARPGFSDPRQGAETCTMVEMMHSDEMLVAITGQALWADRAEEVAFNSLPASMTPDLKGLHYLTGANMIQLDRKSKGPVFDNGEGDMLTYNPFQFRCCQHNVTFGWPYFTEHLFMATQGNGLAAVLYAPGTATARVGRAGPEVTITEETDYPFDEEIRFTLSAAAPVAFPLAVRLPEWAGRPSVSINDEAITLPGNPGGWVTIERVWQPGDRLRLVLPMSVSVKTWDANRKAVSVSRGPLTYSLKIGERWQQYGENRLWPAYEVFPTTPWNYGLVLEGDQAAGIEVVRRATVGSLAPQPFTPDTAPIKLHVKGRRIPQWGQEPSGIVGPLQQSPVRTTEPEETLTLIPMGAARLRITMFPRVGSGADAVAWEESPGLPTASIASHFTPPSAMNDGLVGADSSDASVPWFTWGEQYGTREWAQYTFPRPRTVSWVEVYWADEELKRSSGRVPSDVRLITPTDGRVRLPKACTIEWWDGAAWQPVTGAAGDLLARNRFNRVSFAAVTTTRIRLSVELAPRNSAGIIEWRVGR
jgi:DUF1680 family protein